MNLDISINTIYHEVKDIHKKAMKYLKEKQEDLFIETVAGSMDEYPIRLLTGNPSDHQMLRDAIDFYNLNEAGQEISFIQQYYRMEYRICNYLFDFNDYLDFTKNSIKSRLRRQAKYIYDNFAGEHYTPSGIWNVSALTHFKTNFSPLTAKRIFQTYVQPGGTIYDYSMGYGGRMMGAALCKENYRYLGVDPNADNAPGYEKLEHILRWINPDASILYHISGSEVYHEEWAGQADLCFSSPPYFDLEIYSKDETQAYNMFPDYKDFIEGYWRPTVKNSLKYMKDDGVFALNIKNGKDRKGNVIPFWDDYTRVMEQEGLYPIEIIHTVSNKGCASPLGKNLEERIGFFARRPDQRVKRFYTRALF